MFQVPGPLRIYLSCCLSQCLLLGLGTRAWVVLGSLAFVGSYASMHVLTLRRFRLSQRQRWDSQVATLQILCGVAKVIEARSLTHRGAFADCLERVSLGGRAHGQQALPARGGCQMRTLVLTNRIPDR